MFVVSIWEIQKGQQKRFRQQQETCGKSNFAGGVSDYEKSAADTDRAETEDT